MLEADQNTARIVLLAWSCFVLLQDNKLCREPTTRWRVIVVSDKRRVVKTCNHRVITLFCVALGSIAFRVSRSASIGGTWASRSLTVLGQQRVHRASACLRRSCAHQMTPSWA